MLTRGAKLGVEWVTTPPPPANFKVTNAVRQGDILLPQLSNIYIDGLSDILNKSSLGGSIGGNRINHMLYADDLCIVSLSSAGLQQLLSICDQYCAMHSITFNVKKSVCMFFRCSLNKNCCITNVVLTLYSPQLFLNISKFFAHGFCLIRVPKRQKKIYFKIQSIIKIFFLLFLFKSNISINIL